MAQSLKQLLQDGKVNAYEVLTYNLFKLPAAKEWLVTSKEILFAQTVTRSSLSHEILAMQEGKRFMLGEIESIITRINKLLEEPECLNYRQQSQPMPHELKAKAQQQNQ